MLILTIYIEQCPSLALLTFLIMVLLASHLLLKCFMVQMLQQLILMRESLILLKLTWWFSLVISIIVFSGYLMMKQGTLYHKEPLIGFVRDQLRAEMKAGKVFQGMREAIIRFPPTYKFERGKPGLGGYDSGEKKRIPAWCDRVLYRDNRTSPNVECSLGCPVVASIVQYEGCMEVTESDHKPVRCKFNVELAHIDRSVRREVFGKIFQNNDRVRSILEELRYIPETNVSTSEIVLQNQDTFSLKISNKSREDRVVFQITCSGQSTTKEDGKATEYRPRGSFSFPRWLEVTPAAGIIKPDQAAEILVRHEDSPSLEDSVDGIPQSVDTRDREVTLMISIKASQSTEAKTHQVHVRHSFSPDGLRVNSKNSGRSNQGSSHHRSTLKHTGSTSNKMKDHQNIRVP